VPLRVLPLQREYFATVVEYTIAELRAGRTPSPDVVCNRAIKFGAVIDRLGDEFELVASGHHARVGQRGGLARLLRGADPVKDQSYFLCQLSQRQLARCVFPIGGMTKAEVRAAARRAGLANQDRPDSQGICFLGRVPYDDFVEFSLGTREGDILEHGTGRVLGRHRGYWFHTIGQRRGLGLAGGPWYVVAKDPERNLVTVVHAGRLAEHRRTRFRIAAPVWIAAPPARTRLEVRIRHGERLLPCTAEVAADGSVEVTLDDGDAGIAAGQFAALYDGEECLGGGPVAAEV
ncbi:MAG TPA: tRNA 2-thiouridine(34) synthase MnmA, partial [Thermoanaerobaculales bacterium]|nr:tRNA 2-thiouridine(34) synthase MnmA [Thermoanaerobaculales bacterium]